MYGFVVTNGQIAVSNLLHLENMIFLIVYMYVALPDHTWMYAMDKTSNRPQGKYWLP